MEDSDGSKVTGEIETASPPDPTPAKRVVRTKVPEVEIHLFRQGKGPADVFKASLGGWDQDQLEVRDILDKHGLKSIFAFNPGSGRGAPIRFNPRNGRSMLPYKDGAVIYIDGEPKVRSLAFLDLLSLLCPCFCGILGGCSLLLLNLAFDCGSVWRYLSSTMGMWRL